jgi:6,7-dimethyl-8-ribityllumazine synthase
MSSPCPARWRFRSRWPIALDNAGEAGQPYAGAVALGCIVRGETYHFEIVANESNRMLTAMAVANGCPSATAS